jgi:hypothetical protein
VARLNREVDRLEVETANGWVTEGVTDASIATDVPDRSAPPPAADARRRLSVYLQDHDAGAQAGLALIERCRSANKGTEFEPLLEKLETEVAEDRAALRSVMAGLDVSPSKVKMLAGSAGEFVARLKSNAHLLRYSPSSRVVEFEALIAAVMTKRNMWRSLTASEQSGLSPDALTDLIDRSTNQVGRLLEAHATAAALAFGPSRTSESTG